MDHGLQRGEPGGRKPKQATTAVPARDNEGLIQRDGNKREEERAERKIWGVTGRGESWEERAKDEFCFGHIGFLVPTWGGAPRRICPIGNWGC